MLNLLYYYIIIYYYIFYRVEPCNLRSLVIRHPSHETNYTWKYKICHFNLNKKHAADSSKEYFRCSKSVYEENLCQNFMFFNAVSKFPIPKANWLYQEFIIIESIRNCWIFNTTTKIESESLKQNFESYFRHKIFSYC